MAKRPKEHRPIETEGLDWIASHRSSLIVRFAYEEKCRALVVELTTGDEYQYFTVPREVFEGMAAAESKGSYFHAAVRDKFPYRRTG